jgi:hypothetical protein
MGQLITPACPQAQKDNPSCNMPARPVRNEEEEKEEDSKTFFDGGNPAMGWQQTQILPIKHILSIPQKHQWTLPALIPKLFVDLITSTVTSTKRMHVNTENQC